MLMHHVAVNVLPLYREASRQSEQVSQGLFGQTVTVAEERDGFSHVTTEDRYAGWAQTPLLAPAWNDPDHFGTGIAALFADIHARPDGTSPLLTRLTVGARVWLARRPEVGDWVPLVLPGGDVGYVHKIALNMTHDGAVTGGSELLDQKARRILSVFDLKAQVIAAVGENAARVARRFVGTPYLWGGGSPFGMDCSGLTQLAYRLSGVLLLRDADLQWRDRRFVRVEEGAALGEADLQAGDLVVFGDREAPPTPQVSGEETIESGSISPGHEGQARSTASAGELPPPKLGGPGGPSPRATHIGLALGDGTFLHASATLGGAYVTSCDDERYNALYLGAVRISPDANLGIEAA